MGASDMADLGPLANAAFAYLLHAYAAWSRKALTSFVIDISKQQEMTFAAPAGCHRCQVHLDAPI